MIKDFSLDKYEEICNALVSAGYRSVTLEEYFRQGSIGLSDKRVLLHGEKTA